MNDGQADSSPATVQVTVLNSAPVASFIAPTSALAGAAVALDARSSTDANAEDTLTYSWRFVSVPSESGITTASITPNGTTLASQASFTPDVAGVYQVRLTVGDGTDTSFQDRSVIVSSQAQPPVAAIQAQSLQGGPQIIELNGSGSHSGSTGSPLVSYQWTLIASPAGATAFTSSTVAVRYNARLAGIYTFELTVTDQLQATGTTTVSIIINNVAPVADAGFMRCIVLPRFDVTTTLRTTDSVKVDARRSTDANGDTLTYSWSIAMAPDQANPVSTPTTMVTITGGNTATPTLHFRTDLYTGTDGLQHLVAAGLYKPRVVVSDGTSTSIAEVLVLATDPKTLAPNADAGIDATYQVDFLVGGGVAPTIPDPTADPASNLRAFVRLDGNESVDSQGRRVTYRWTVARDENGGLMVPSGSTLTALDNPNTTTPTFVPDREGVYTFELVVNNGLLDSEPDRVSVEVVSTNHPPAADISVEDLARLLTATPQDAPMAVVTGDRIVLRGDSSFDPDLSDRSQLTYQWTQLKGRTVALQPNATSAVVSFAPQRNGLHEFQLVVTDPHGVESAPEVIRILVLDPGQSRPLLSVTASALTTVDTGQSEP
ncbi:MAG: PKD domain-containing protein, partial [Acidimicrobiaceae bacterium]